MYDQDQLNRALLESAQSLVNDNVIVGKPIISGDTTVVPIFKATIGIAGGGHTGDSAIGFGGSGAGMSVSPVTFLVISNGHVQLISAGENTQLERLISAAPGLVDKLITAFAPERAEEEQ